MTNNLSPAARKKKREYNKKYGLEHYGQTCSLCGTEFSALPLQAQAGICTMCAILWYIVKVMGEQPCVEAKPMAIVPIKWWQTPEKVEATTTREQVADVAVCPKCRTVSALYEMNDDNETWHCPACHLYFSLLASPAPGECEVCK